MGKQTKKKFNQGGKEILENYFSFISGIVQRLGRGIMKRNYEYKKNITFWLQQEAQEMTDLLCLGKEKKRAIQHLCWFYS